MDSKKKICFVVDTLANHGAERFLVEVLKTLDRQKFNITVYVTRELTGFETHYKEEITDLGIPIIFHRDDPFYNDSNSFLKRLKTSLLYRLKFLREKDKIIKLVFHQKKHFLAQFDVLSIIKWEVYNHQRQLFDLFDNKVIHILSVNSQYADSPFDVLPKKKTKFILMSPKERAFIFPEVQEEDETYKFYDFPLIINDRVFTENYNPHEKEIRIGIFSRISKDQPTSFAFYLVHLLKCRGYDVKLFFYGKILDQELFSFYKQLISNLRIKNNVVFMGHTFSLGNSIMQDQISFGIMNNASGFMGYSSIEIIAHELPLFFFNIDPMEYNNNDTDNVFNSLEEMCDSIEKCLKSGESLRSIASSQRKDLQNNHMAISEIHKLEKIYTEV